MNSLKIEKSIKKYQEYLSQNDQAKTDINDRKERIAYYQKFNEQKLMKLEEDEFVEFIGKLWASAIYGNKKYIVDKMINENKGFGNLKKMLVDFLYGKQDVTMRWDKFLREAKFFGPSYMSELLGYIYPKEYALANLQVIKALEFLEMENMPHYNYQFNGKKYLEICDAVKMLSKELERANVHCENLLAVDYYLWEVTRLNVDETAKESGISLEPTTSKEQEFVHKEIIEKIVQIGNLLGFDAEQEVRVGKGAIVDAVWSINIGNMGRIMYVFEVQTKGSIDSLILNLQKANNNKAVQAIISVSDEAQLKRIKDESEEIESLKDLKLWDYKDVLNVYDSLNTAMTSINKLGLVPKGF